MKFFKLLKYEFLENIASVALINIVLLILLYFMRFFIYSRTNDLHWILGIFLSLSPIVIITSLVFLLNIIIKTLYSRLFSKEGYLTLSLPLSIDSILISKILISMLWVAISAFVFWLWLADIGDRFHFWHKIFRIILENYSLFDILSFVAFCFIFVLKPIILVMLILSILNIGKINRFRKVIGILLFFVILSIEYISITSIYIIVDSIFGTSISPTIPFNPNIETSIFEVILYLLIYMLPIFVYYFFSRYLIKNKLEI